MKTHAGEAYYTLVVDIPLLIVQEAAAGLGDGFEEGVNRGGAAPLQIVVVLLDQIPEAAGVAGFHAIHPSAVAPGNLFHLIATGDGCEGIAVAAAHMRHIDAEYP
jgi:hypothetical protein